MEYSLDKKTRIPSTALYSANHVVGSPRSLSVLPGAADYPNTFAYGPGLEAVIAGIAGKFTIQARDSQNNNKTTGGYVFDVDIVGPASAPSANDEIYGSQQTKLEKISVVPEYVGGGRYAVSWTPKVSGNYSISITMGGTHIYCGKGVSKKCSPYSAYVAPGPTSHETSIATGHGMSDAVAGVVSSFTIQAKDTYGNLRLVGGDTFDVLLTNKVDSNTQYRGIVEDQGNSSYIVTYTILQVGHYKVEVRYGGHLILTGKDADLVTNANADYSFPEILCVHWKLYAPTSVATGPGLTNAIDAVQTSFTINAKDPFGNDRRGDRTPDGLGSGTGFDDPFLVEFFGPDNYYDVTSSAIQTIYTTATSNINGTFTVSIDGKTTPDLPHDISASSMRDVLENLHVPRRRLKVSRSAKDTHGLEWRITYISHLENWKPSELSMDPSSLTGTLVSGNITTEALVLFIILYDTRYGKQRFSVHVTVGQEKVHVKNSPFSVHVDDGVVHPTTSTSVGQGLVSGTAGDAFNFTVQAKDTRNIEVQTISTSAYVVPTVHEVQNLTCVKQSGSFTVSFRGVDSGSINFNDNAMTVANTLEAMPTISTVTVSHVRRRR